VVVSGGSPRKVQGLSDSRRSPQRCEGGGGGGEALVATRAPIHPSHVLRVSEIKIILNRVGLERRRRRGYICAQKRTSWRLDAPRAGGYNLFIAVPMGTRCPLFMLL